MGEPMPMLPLLAHLDNVIDLASETDRALCTEAGNAAQFAVKDSGERTTFASGMVRDVTAGKIDWHRVADGPMLRRWAEHLTKGKAKYNDIEPGVPNWTLAAGREEYERFRQSAFRHFVAWFYGERDEDHGAAVFFNINGAEYVASARAVTDDDVPF